MSKAIVSLGCGPQERLLRLATRTFRPYAARHGYALELHTEPVDATRPAPWSKVPLLRSAVARHEVVVWLDADLMIVDGREDLAAALPADRLMALAEHTTHEVTMPNTGVWVLRGGEEAVGLLDAVWAQEDLVQHRWWENAAVSRLLGSPVEPGDLAAPTALRTDRTALLDGRWNSIRDDPSPRPRIRHYPGFSLKTRTAFMLRDAAVVGARRATGRW